MFAYRVLALFFALTVIRVNGQNELNQAGQQIGDAFANVGNFFVRQYKNVQSLFANSKEDLANKVKQTSDFLGQLKTNYNNLISDARQRADTQLQAALGNVDRFNADVNEFQQKVNSATSPQQIEQLENEWKQKTQTMYNDGLNKIIQTAESAKAAGSAVSKSTFLVSTALIIFVAKIMLQ